MSNRQVHPKSFARRVATQALFTPTLFIVFATSAAAQTAEELSQQQMEVMKQYMEAAGMSEEDIAKNQSMINNTMGPLVEAQAAEEAREQAEFEARTAGLGKAVIAMAGSEAELRITECVTKENGDWYVKAQDSADTRSSLSFGGDTHYRRSVLWMYIKDVGGIEDFWVEPMVPIKDGRAEWAGKAKADLAGGGFGEAEVSLSIDCGSGS